MANYWIELASDKTGTGLFNLFFNLKEKHELFNVRTNYCINIIFVLIHLSLVKENVFFRENTHSLGAFQSAESLCPPKSYSFSYQETTVQVIKINTIWLLINSPLLFKLQYASPDILLFVVAELAVTKTTGKNTFGLTLRSGGTLTDGSQLNTWNHFKQT